MVGVISLSYHRQEEEQSDSGSDSDDQVAELPSQRAPVRKGPRTSVSAEVFGTWNKKKDFQPPKYAKAPAVREALKNRLE